jgi:small subunit ribosomal protein S20
VANTKSALKQIRVSERKRLRNRPVKTYVRSAEEQIADGVESSPEAVRRAVSALDRAADKGILHKNNAARRKSRLMKRLNAMQAQAAAPVVAPEPTKRSTRTTARAAGGTATKPRARAKKS